MKLLIVIVSLVALCNGFNLGIDKFASTASTAVKQAIALVKKQEATDSSIVKYQSGNTVNVLGEISDFPNAFTTTAESFNSFKTAVVSILNLLASAGEDTKTSQSGGNFAVPNAIIEPYISRFGAIESTFSNGVDCIQNIANIFSQQLVPFLSDISMSSQGGMDVPSSAVTEIISNIQKIVRVVQTIADILTDAAVASKKAETEVNASFKASTLLNALNSACVKFKSDMAGVLTSTNNYIANLPITAVSSETDRINGKVIFKDINTMLIELNAGLKIFSADLADFANYINIIRNPFAGALLNLF